MVPGRLDLLCRPDCGLLDLEGAWIYAVGGPKFAYVIVFAVAVYPVTFVGIFFNVALVGAADRNLEGEPAGVGEGCGVAWERLGEIAGWTAFSVFVSLVLALIKVSRVFAGWGPRPGSPGASRRSSSFR